MEDNDDFRASPAPRRGLAGLLQRLLPAQQVPEPFRDSDFEHVDWHWNAPDPRTGAAD
ncbi:hypothetical protein [Ramlibacter sp. Leaf400]|uniref:hypothetical protein n=1 Tax=Ramlibacter sp. Leaf400 TaxID=1736365 RepID=UPI0012E33364|nr:hypothetical protein [Ramlibacter sp. Leaf400]